MNTKRWLWGLVLGTPIICVLVLFINVESAQRSRNNAYQMRQQAWDQLEMGMSQEQVDSLMMTASRHYTCGPFESVEGLVSSWEYYTFGAEDPDRGSTMDLRFRLDENTNEMVLEAVYDVEYYLVDPYTETCRKVR